MTEAQLDNITDDEQDDPNESSVMRNLRKEAKAGREAVARATAAEADARSAQRELAMRRAGVDLDSPLGAMFSKAWDGEIDVDMMRESWSQVAGSAPAQDDPRRGAMERISAAAGGGQASGGAPVDFEAELDSIPMYVDTPQGKVQNPDYVNEVLAKTAVQAAREGRQFGTVGKGATKWTNSPSSAAPAVNPL